MNGSTWHGTRPGVPAVGRGRARADHECGSRPVVALLIAGEAAPAVRYRRRLSLDGYSILSASSLGRGLELASAYRPDVIFVCLGAWALPQLVLAALRSTPATADLPIVLVSDRTPARLSSEVGGLRANEHVMVSRALRRTTDRPATPRPASCAARRGGTRRRRQL